MRNHPGITTFSGTFIGSADSELSTIQRLFRARVMATYRNFSYHQSRQHEQGQREVEPYSTYLYTYTRMTRVIEGWAAQGTMQINPIKQQTPLAQVCRRVLEEVV